MFRLVPYHKIINNAEPTRYRAGGEYEGRTRDLLLAGQALVPTELIPHMVRDVGLEPTRTGH